MCIKLKKAAKSASVVPMDAPAQKNSRVPAPAVVKIVNKNKEILGLRQGFLLLSFKTIVFLQNYSSYHTFRRIHTNTYAQFYRRVLQKMQRECNLLYGM